MDVRETGKESFDSGRKRKRKIEKERVKERELERKGGRDVNGRMCKESGKEDVRESGKRLWERRRT